MRDTARAAAMSDPTENRWFRRRWVDKGVPKRVLMAEPAPASALLPVPGSSVSVTSGDGDLEMVGRELLAAWRRERAQAGGHRDA